MIRVGILSFSDGRPRVHNSLLPYIRSTEEALKTALAETGIVEIVLPEQVICSIETAQDIAYWMLGMRVDACILNVCVFAFPNFSAIAARVLRGIPLLAIAPINGHLPGLGGLQAAVGMIRQTGGQCAKIWGNVNTPDVQNQLMAFLRGAHAVSALKGQVYGVFGGRSIGMGTGTASGDVWLDLFGVDMDHVDQGEILRRANLVPAEKTSQAMDWLTRHLSAIECDGKKLTEQTLAQQVNCYIATKELVLERGFSFIGVQCHYDMSEYFTTQCLTAAFMNDPYDWDGVKEPIIMSCEADADAALTMQILKLISGKPVIFMDFRHFSPEDGLFTFCNCGACATWYAARSENAADNLKHVRLCPVIEKYGGSGCHVQLIAEDAFMTFARLTHQMDRYLMQVFTGEFKKLPVERLQETCPAWPHGFASVNSDPMALIDQFASNHIHAVEGNYIEALRAFCDIKGIPMEILS